MAKRRMLSLELLRSDEFLDLPAESQLLYVHLSVEADDDGFLCGKKRILSMLGLPEEAFTRLAEAGFLLTFPSGAAVIAHWPLLNKIPKDRYVPTRFQTEYRLLTAVHGVGYVLKSEDAPLREDKPAGSALDAQEPAQPAQTGPAQPPEDWDENDPCTLPLSDGGTYRLTPEQAERWELLYPGVKLRQEFRSMRGWLLTHPERKKTAENVDRFISHWLQTALERRAVLQSTPYGRTAPEEHSYSEAAMLADLEMMSTVPKLTKRRR